MILNLKLTGASPPPTKASPPSLPSPGLLSNDYDVFDVECSDLCARSMRPRALENTDEVPRVPEMNMPQPEETAADADEVPQIPPTQMPQTTTPEMTMPPKSILKAQSRLPVKKESLDDDDDSEACGMPGDDAAVDDACEPQTMPTRVECPEGVAAHIDPVQQGNVDAPQELPSIDVPIEGQAWQAWPEWEVVSASMAVMEEQDEVF